MFKIVAVLGLVAGGAGYAVYEYTDLFGCNGSATCPQAKQPCCTQQPVTPECCELQASCESEKVAAVKKPCCASCCEEKTTTAAAKLAASCADPHLAGALIACEACAEYGASNATAAVAGVAALVPVK
jgi:hypothetical protein